MPSVDDLGGIYTTYIEITDPNANLVYNGTSPFDGSFIHILTAGTSSGENTSVWPTNSGTYAVHAWWQHGPEGREYHTSGTFQYNWEGPVPVTWQNAVCVTVDDNSITSVLSHLRLFMNRISP